jgi:hypothetical protein
MHSNRQTSFTLVARLVKGQSADGTALTKALFIQIGNRTASNQKAVMMTQSPAQ